MFSGFYFCVFCFFSHHRVKLAEWLASKGKTLKRPAMTTGKPKVSAKPQPDLKTRPEPVAMGNPEPCLESQEPDSAALLCADTQRAELTAHGQTPAIMNTTLDLLDNSDPDLPVDPQDRVDDVSKQGGVLFFFCLLILPSTFINHLFFFFLNFDRLL